MKKARGFSSALGVTPGRGRPGLRLNGNVQTATAFFSGKAHLQQAVSETGGSPVAVGLRRQREGPAEAPAGAFLVKVVVALGRKIRQGPVNIKHLVANFNTHFPWRHTGNFDNIEYFF